MKVIVIGTSLSGKTTLYKYKVLAPKVIDEVLNKESVLFFTNTDYFSDEELTILSN
jgi:hypothetical protein